MLKINLNSNKSIQMLKEAVFKCNNGYYYIIYQNTAYDALTFTKMLSKA